VNNFSRNSIYTFAEIDEVDRFGFTLLPIMLEDHWVGAIFNTLLSHRTLTPWGGEFPIAETEDSNLKRHKWQRGHKRNNAFREGAK